MSRVLVVEDDRAVSAFLDRGFRAAGFATTVVKSGEDALERISDEADFDLIVLDLGLPGRGGISVLEELRTTGNNTPVVVLTGAAEVSQKVAGLDAGADDYITKPFLFEELMARVRARLRSPQTSRGDVLEAGPISLDLRTRWARRGEEDIELSLREFTLLETLMRHPNQVLSREQLLSAAWGYDHDPGSNVVDVYVGYLRRKIGGDLIETVRGAGYRFRV